MDIPVLALDDLTRKIESLRRPWHKNYLAMYSSVWGGIITDPVLMTVPVDDHLVHRADGVFDVFRCAEGKAYCLTEHLERLQRSAKGLDLKMPPEFPDIIEIIKKTVRVTGDRNAVVRVLVSRGPGGFSTNPFECPSSQLYVIITKLKSPAPVCYKAGIPIISAPVPVKHQVFANIKSADYLGNVLVKKIAVEAGVDFAVTWDEEGYLAEGSTENVMLVSPERELLIPSFDRVLKGVTISRAAKLAEKLIDEGLLAAVRTAKIDRKLAANCPEVMLTGTTLDILPVTTWDQRPVGSGRPGPVARRLLELVRLDMTENNEVLTDLFAD